MGVNAPFITIEGIDGGGKTTLVEGDEDVNGLQGYFPNACFTREPDDDTIHGKHVRRVIKDETAPPMAVFFAFLADHAAHVENTVRPALEDGTPVFCDRYIDSRYAYQASELDEIVGDPLAFIRSIQEEGWSIFPDLTLLIDIEPEEAIKRVGGRGDGQERFEKLDSLKEKRDIYLTLAEEYPNRFEMVDGVQYENASKNKEAVMDSCLDIILDQFAELEP